MTLRREWPLVSELKKVDDSGIQGPRTDAERGRFFSIGNEAEALRTVVGQLKGLPVRRESIPSVLAQEEVFRLCVKEYGEKTVESIAVKSRDTQTTQPENTIVAQWKGAVAAKLLINDLMIGADEANIEYGVKHIVRSSDAGSAVGKDMVALDPDNRFVQRVYAAIGDLGKTWKAHCFTLKEKTRPLALFQESEELIAIPAANLNGFLTVKSHHPWLTQIPWLQSEKDETDRWYVYFEDPLPSLDIVQIEKLSSELNKLCNDPTAEKLNKDAIQLFRQELEEILASSEKREKVEEKFYSVKRVVFAALLMRDALKARLFIREKEDFSGVKQKWVFFSNWPIARLDEKKLLILNNPAAYQNSQIFETLKEEVNQCLSQSGCKLMIQIKIKTLASKFQEEMVIRLLEEVTKDQDKVDPIAAILRAQETNEIDLSGDKEFSAFRADFTKPDLTADTFFSRYVLCFNPGTSPKGVGERTFYNENIVPKEWYTIKIAGKEPSDPALLVLLPFGAVGAYFLAPKIMNAGQRKNIDIQITQNGSGKARSISAQLSYQMGGFSFQFVREYTQERREIIDLQENYDVPAIGIWPDIGFYSYGENSWKEFYTYIHFPIRMHDYSAEVFYPEPKPVNAVPQGVRGLQKLQGTFKTPNLYEQWGIAKGVAFPLFVLLKNEHGIPVGIVPCAPSKDGEYKSTGKKAILGVDFGMSSTVAACLYRDPSDKDMQAGMIADIQGADFQPRAGEISPTSGVAWQMNRDYGVEKCEDPFMAEEINVVKDDGNGQRRYRSAPGAMFSLVRRFDQEEYITEDNADKFTDVFFHGNIKYLGNNEPVKDARVFTKFKFKEGDSQRNNSNVELFLKQALKMYLFRCYQEGIQSAEVRFAMPLAMSESQQSGFRNVVKKICESIKSDTGITITGPRFTSESRAVAAYYFNSRKLNGIQSTDVIVAMDIGGGTTDFSIVKKGQQPAKGNDERDDYYSTLLAGHVMLAGRLFESNHPAIRAEVATLLSSSVFQEPQQEMKSKISNQVRKAIAEKNKDFFALLLDYKLRTSDPTLLGLIQNEESMTHQMIVFQIALLGWFARILFEEKYGATQVKNDSGGTKTVKPKFVICLAGNGASFYTMMHPEVQARIKSSIAGDLKTSFGGILESPEEKMEVAKGLLLTPESDFFEEQSTQSTPKKAQKTPRKEHAKIPSALDGKELWGRFKAFLKRYNTAFPDNMLLKDFFDNQVNMNKLEDEFQNSYSQIKSLCENLPNLCEKLGIANEAQKELAATGTNP